MSFDPDPYTLNEAERYSGFRLGALLGAYNNVISAGDHELAAKMGALEPGVIYTAFQQLDSSDHLLGEARPTLGALAKVLEDKPELVAQVQDMPINGAAYENLIRKPVREMSKTAALRLEDAMHDAKDAWKNGHEQAGNIAVLNQEKDLMATKRSPFL